MVKASDLREKTIQELRDEEERLSHEFFKARMELTTGQLTNYKKIKLIKKDLARVKTVIREKELNIR